MFICPRDHVRIGYDGRRHVTSDVGKLQRSQKLHLPRESQSIATQPFLSCLCGPCVWRDFYTLDIVLLNYGWLPTICVLQSGIYCLLKQSKVGSESSLLCLMTLIVTLYFKPLMLIQLRVADGMILFVCELAIKAFGLCEVSVTFLLMPFSV